MRGIQTVLGIMRADLRNRTKRNSFWIIIALTVLITSFFIPADGARYLTVSFEEYRGIYNSAWVGTVAAMTVSWCLGLFGFYLVKDSIEDDEKTRVGQLIESSPVKKATYLFGKFLSNIGILSFILFTSIVVAILLQFIRGESYVIELLDYIVPYLVIAFPALIFISALAILFQTVPILKGVPGNIVFFFFFAVSLLERLWYIEFKEVTIIVGDLFANSIAIQGMKTIAYLEIPNYTGRASQGFIFQQNPTQTFVFDGVEWSLGIILGRLIWVLGAIIIIYLAAFLFKGFDPASRGGAIKQNSKRQLRSKKVSTIAVKRCPPSPGVPQSAGKFRMIKLLLIEIKLMIKGRPSWWYGFTATLIVFSILSSPETHRYFLPILWLWPISLFSSLGVREFYDNTVQLILSCSISVRKHIFTMWLSGVIVAVAIGGGIGVRLLINGDWQQALALLVGALFIPAMALCLGVLTQTKRVFEVAYFLLWYMGPLNGIWFLDYIGASFASWQLSWTYLGVACTLLVVTIIIRRHQFNTLFD